MAKLAEAYIAIRAYDVGKDTNLNPGEGYTPRERGKKYLYDERHLLGIPLTNHPRGGGESRHASPVRFVVKAQDGGFRGFVLHVPHGHSTAQRFAHGVKAEKVWEKVHRKLDGMVTLVSRASYKEVLS